MIAGMDRSPCLCLLCKVPPDVRWHPRDARIASNVLDHGWHIQGVRADNQTPGWAYSIGMWHTLRSADLAVFGLPPIEAALIINQLGQEVRNGFPLHQDEPRVMFTGYPVRLRVIRESWSPLFLGAGTDFSRTPFLPGLQVFWPDQQGHFPWDDGADERCHTNQPLLWLEREEHPPGLWASYDP